MERQEEEQQKLYRLVNEDVQQLNSLQKELDLLETKKEATQEAFLIAEKKLDQGLISIIEFYTAKNQLAQAETEWIRTLLQLKIKEKTIRIYLGEELF
jgi:outer membrane protein TolC